MYIQYYHTLHTYRLKDEEIVFLPMATVVEEDKTPAKTNTMEGHSNKGSRIIRSSLQKLMQGIRRTTAHHTRKFTILYKIAPN